MIGREIYKKDSTGKIRVWYAEYEETRYRTVSGVLDGKMVESGWVYPEQKNIGKANETTIGEQVESEVKSKYEHQLNQGQYHENIEDAKNDVSKYFAPMLAQTYKEKMKYPLASQPKLDGFRCVPNDAGLWSRKGKPFVSCPHIFEGMQELHSDHPEVQTDGELYNHILKDEFEKISSLVRKSKPTQEHIHECERLVQFHTYNIFIETKPDAGFVERHEYLENLYEKGYFNPRYFNLVPYTIVNNDDERDEMAMEYLEQGYEGQMLLTLDGPYEANKRSKHLQKNKPFEDAEFEIVDIIEGIGTWAGRAKSVEIRLENGETQYSGIKGDFAFTEQLLKDREQLIGTDVTIVFAKGRTKDGKLRFPVAKTFWGGKRDA